MNESDTFLTGRTLVCRRILQPDDESTIFLVAGYARYACPYVWVRSNHERLTKPGQSASRSSLKVVDRINGILCAPHVS